MAMPDSLPVHFPAPSRSSVVVGAVSAGPTPQVIPLEAAAGLTNNVNDVTKTSRAPSGRRRSGKPDGQHRHRAKKHRDVLERRPNKVNRGDSHTA